MSTPLSAHDCHATPSHNIYSRPPLPVLHCSYNQHCGNMLFTRLPLTFLARAPRSALPEEIRLDQMFFFLNHCWSWTSHVLAKDFHRLYRQDHVPALLGTRAKPSTRNQAQQFKFMLLVFLDLHIEVTFCLPAKLTIARSL